MPVQKIRSTEQKSRQCGQKMGTDGVNSVSEQSNNSQKGVNCKSDGLDKSQTDKAIEETKKRLVS